MKVGINWTGTRDLPTVRQMIARGEVDFVEIMIDIFLSCSAWVPSVSTGRNAMRISHHEFQVSSSG